MAGVDADAWDARYADEDRVWGAEPNRFVVQYLSDLTPGTAIDLGAGEGRNAVWLARQGWQVTAVDFSAVGLEKARAMAADAQVPLATVAMDVESFHPNVPVDLVVLSYLQIPDAHQVRLLRRMQDWLKSGGRVFVVAHDKANQVGGPPDPGVRYSIEQTLAALDGMHIEVAEVADRDGALDTVVLAVRTG
jgi:SAM-dependent methyltransferase